MAIKIPRKAIPEAGKKRRRNGRQAALEVVRPSREHLTADEAAVKLKLSEATIRQRMRVIKFRGTVQRGRYRFVTPKLFAEWVDLEARRAEVAKNLGTIADGRFAASNTLEFRTTMGRVAAEVFVRFAHGDSPAECVMKLARPPAEIMKLWDEYAAMKSGITVDARQLLAMSTLVNYDPEVPSGEGLVEAVRKRVNGLVSRVAALESQLQTLKEAAKKEDEKPESKKP